MEIFGYKPFKDDTFVLVDNYQLDNLDILIKSLPLEDSQLHFISKETVGVWKIKGKRYNGFNSIFKLHRHLNPF